MNTKKRIDDFDFIKGVLIIFVIWGHCCMCLSGPDYEKNALTTYIRLFQMPLFIFISGYFQKSISTVSEGFLYLKKKPSAYWSPIGFLDNCSISVKANGQCNHNTKCPFGREHSWHSQSVLVSSLPYHVPGMFRSTWGSEHKVA